MPQLRIRSRKRLQQARTACGPRVSLGAPSPHAPPSRVLRQDARPPKRSPPLAIRHRRARRTSPHRNRNASRASPASTPLPGCQAKTYSRSLEDKAKRFRRDWRFGMTPQLAPATRHRASTCETRASGKSIRDATPALCASACTDGEGVAFAENQAAELRKSILKAGNRFDEEVDSVPVRQCSMVGDNERSWVLPIRGRSSR